jgi:hypothetical protein
MPDEKREEWWMLLSHPMVKDKYGHLLDADLDDDVSRAPSHLPILPLRGLVVYPMTAVPNMASFVSTWIG